MQHLSDELGSQQEPRGPLESSHRSLAKGEREVELRTCVDVRRRLPLPKVRRYLAALRSQSRGRDGAGLRTSGCG